MRRPLALLAVLVAIAAAVAVGVGEETPQAAPQEVALPAPVTKGTMSVEEALTRRRSVRAYETKALTREQLGQLLWAMQGITDPATGHRTAPSAMARYPLTVYVFDEHGVFSYEPQGHKLITVSDKDQRPDLAEVSQRPVGQAPVTFVITGDASKLGTRFPARAEQFVALEVGHVAQNLALQATALGLGTLTIGGFDPAAVAKLLSLPVGQAVIYVMPVGYPAAR
jgi:SagB-type dehydrogenase family enzyme